MSSCLGPKFIRVVAGLATQSSQSISSSNRARRPEQPMQSRFLPSRIPVPSPRNTYSYPSSNIALPATLPTPSRKPISVPTSSSRKTEDSILKHVERLRKVQAAKSTYKTSAFKTASKVAQPVSRPVSRPTSRVPSTHSVVSSSPSSVARTDSSIDAHIQRITKARASRPNSARSSPATSRRVTPTQPLLIKKKMVLAKVDLTTVDSKLAKLSVAPSPAQADKPSIPGLRSCLKNTLAGKLVKSVRFVEYGGWLRHGIRVHLPDSRPTSFISDPRRLDQSLLRPPPTRGDSNSNYSLLSPSEEICWPPQPWDPSFIGYPGVPPSSCLSCRLTASRGTPHTRSHANMQTIMCSECMSLPDRRKYFYPALDIRDDDPGCSTCHGSHDVDPEHCQIYQSAYKSNVYWLYSHYPERFDELDAILNS
ncbi:hypothetical protein BKA61DRAFT_697200 [Leptodontidium sp. MPI-SDFR-AT-0119]|nr:hypothetical protein BKA61DRAFT_697200 [Leptodontidium sp. MPI-SDFR-AT-0119]